MSGPNTDPGENSFPGEIPPVDPAGATASGAVAPPSPPPAVSWQPPPSDAPEIAGPSGPVVRLWRPRDIGWTAVFLGFPAGIGLAARNWYRLGRPGRAVAHLLAGAAALLLVLLSPDVRGLAFALNVGFVIYLYRATSSDVRALALAGRPVETAGVASGFATIAGGWALMFTPALLVSFAITALGGSVDQNRSGTIEFGTGGTGCAVTRPATTFRVYQPIRFAVFFSRDAKAGEVIRAVIATTSGHVDTRDITIDALTNCYGVTMAAGVGRAGPYTVEYDIGTERLAVGAFVVASASASPDASTAATVPSASATATASDAFAAGLPHEDLALEAKLPLSVGGKMLALWSVRGKDYFSSVLGLGESDVTAIETELSGEGLTLDDVSVAFGGRSFPSDPPYAVMGHRFAGIAADRLESTFGIPDDYPADHPGAGPLTSVSVGGKQVMKGTLAMVDQTAHARGLPYFYDTGEVRFMIITDDEKWAADAIRQLP